MVLQRGVFATRRVTTRGSYNRVLELGESDDGDDFNECSNLEVYWDELDDWYNLEDWVILINRMTFMTRVARFFSGYFLKNTF